MQPYFNSFTFHDLSLNSIEINQFDSTGTTISILDIKNHNQKTEVIKKKNIDLRSGKVSHFDQPFIKSFP